MGAGEAMAADELKFCALADPNRIAGTKAAITTVKVIMVLFIIPSQIESLYYPKDAGARIDAAELDLKAQLNNAPVRDGSFSRLVRPPLAADDVVDAPHERDQPDTPSANSGTARLAHSRAA